MPTTAASSHVGCLALMLTVATLLPAIYEAFERLAKRDRPLIPLGAIVHVVRIDSSSVCDWTYDPVNLKRRPHESVGFLTDMDSQPINVRPHRAIDADGDEQHVGSMVIHLVAVLSIKSLRQISA